MKAHIVETGSLAGENQTLEAIKAIFSTAHLTDVHRALAKKSKERNVGGVEQLAEFCFSEVAKITPESNEVAKLRNQLLSQILQFQTERLEIGDCYDPRAQPKSSAVVWPDPTSGTSALDTDIFVGAKGLLNKSTPVGSVGCCFSFKIAHWLQQSGFNYLVTEKNLRTDRGTHGSTARWGTLPTAAALRQMVERAFGLRDLPNYLWSKTGEDGRAVLGDPFREEIQVGSVEEYLADLPQHQNAARQALSSAKVFVLTLGSTEVWSLRSDGSVLSQSPPQLSPDYVKRHVLGVGENVAELQRMLDVWRKFNPDLELIVSVSPEPVERTFRAGQMDEMAATMLAKATLRVAAQQFCDANAGVYYFPSLEKIMFGTRDPWAPRLSQLSPQAVKGVIELFERSFVVQPSYPSTERKQAADFLESIGRPREFSAVTGAVEVIKNAVQVPTVRSLLDAFLGGYCTYAKTGVTPEMAYLSMRQLFAATNGAFNRIVSEAIQRAAPALSLPSGKSLFGNSMVEVLAGLNANGYWVFEEKLETEAVDHLVSFAMETPANGRAGGGKPQAKATFSEMRKFGNALFQFDEAELVSHEDVWAVCKKPAFVELARAYLQCEPILDLVTMWWSLAVPSNQQEQSAAAQLFHFDLDRLSFLKFFIYLTDVTPVNGPHCYVAGSHRGFRDAKLQRDGRFSDAEIKAYYPSEEVQIVGQKGTVFVADTKGFHKGLPLESGERLIFQIEFSNSLFGAPYVGWKRVPAGEAEEARQTQFAKMARGI